MRYIDNCAVEEARRLIGSYAAVAGAEEADIEAYLRDLVDPELRQAAVADDHWQQYMDIPGGFWLANFYVLSDDETLFPSLDRMRQEGIATYAVYQMLLASYRDQTLLEHPETQRRMRAGQAEQRWRENGLPDFCARGHQSWICDIETTAN